MGPLFTQLDSRFVLSRTSSLILEPFSKYISFIASLFIFRLLYIAGNKSHKFEPEYKGSLKNIHI